MSKSVREIKIAYLGQVAPFEPEFYNESGYGRPGSLAQLGFIEALYNTKIGLDRAWGFRPIGHWPHGHKQFEWIRRFVLPCGARLTLVPLINHFFLREISRYFILAWLVVVWSVQRMGHPRIIVMYNLLQPNGVCWMRFLTWITHTKLVPIIYDLAQMKMYRKRLLFRLAQPDWLDRVHEKFIPLCDGMLPITDAIPRDFAPQLKYLRVDGGVGEAVVSSLPKLKVRKVEEGELLTFTIFYAGGITPWNRIDILLKYMEKNKDPTLRLWVAGCGRDVPMVEVAAARDPRITFYGFLGPNKLNELYGRCDMLVILRDLMDPGLKYHYPSKTFEMLVMGKPLVVTNSQHTKDLYGDYCKVIDICNVDTYGEAVEYFMKMTPEARLAYGERARAYALENRRWCTWGRAIGDYLIEVAHG